MPAAWGMPRLSRCSVAQLGEIRSRLERWWTANGRDGDASQAQLDLLQDLWKRKSWKRDKASFERWAHSHFSVYSVTAMSTGMASKVINALRQWGDKVDELKPKKAGD